MSPMGFDTETSRIVWSKFYQLSYAEISTNAVSRGGYKPTTVLTTSFLLYKP
jgi:hypothetical protein